MKKLITLFAIAGMVLALAPAAQAAITATGTLDPVATATWESGTVSQGAFIAIGNTADGTVTVTAGSTLNITNTGGFPDEITIGENTGASNLGKLDIQAGGTVNVTMNAVNTMYFQVGGGASGSQGLINVIGAGAALNVDAQYIQIGHNGNGEVVVDGGGVVNHTCTTPSTAELEVGSWSGGEGLLTIQGSDGSGNASTVQTQKLTLGAFGTTGYVHMGADGVLVVDGDKTTNPFVSGGLFTLGGTGEIQYNPSGTWVNMTGAATEGTDYTLTYAASGADPINGQDVNGYTVLTMAGGGGFDFDTYYWRIDTYDDSPSDSEPQPVIGKVFTFNAATPPRGLVRSCKGRRLRAAGQRFQ